MPHSSISKRLLKVIMPQTMWFVGDIYVTGRMHRGGRIGFTAEGIDVIGTNE